MDKYGKIRFERKAKDMILLADFLDRLVHLGRGYTIDEENGYIVIRLNNK